MANLGKPKEWSRSLICRPKDNLTTEAGIRAQQHVMVPTVDRKPGPDSMSNLMGMEYARMWTQDRNDFVQKRASNTKTKVIKNDFEWWLKQRKTNKCFCTI